ncbi:MAG: DUF2786 domain-containing protein [Candidatus Marinimicrobia bacterium]|nr:DUF2786 domain-containing protein [Candidatus Neomarinimicrobiota bacterium]
MDRNKEEKMIAKIRNLFALAANDGATGSESETALRMANALLAKHSIEKFRLHEEDEVFASFMDYPIAQDWVKKVISHITRFYNCRVIFDYNWTPAKSMIIGTSANRITAIIVIDQLISQIKKEKGNIAFKNGAAFGLYEKCKEILDGRENKHEEVIPGTGLTIIDVEEQQKINVDDFIKANYNNLSSGRRGGKAMSAEGRAYGQGLNPNARVGGASQKCLN